MLWIVIFIDFTKDKIYVKIPEQKQRERLVGNRVKDKNKIVNTVKFCKSTVVLISF